MPTQIITIKREEWQAMSENTLKHDLLPDAQAAAEFLGDGFNRNMVYYLVKTGQLRAIRKGGRMYFRKSWLIEDFSNPAVAGAA